ncbi:AraC family transcriptional regulator [Gordonia sp. CPCC 206044]|uniref:helix-turn-helix domain-containing protein n=1 Tax=Gordonia sp. CPCC 206044 TaxID=3140793 RepID=UPI003AF3D399
MTPTSGRDRDRAWHDRAWAAHLPGSAHAPPTEVRRLHRSAHALLWEVCGSTEFDFDDGESVSVPGDHAIWVPAGTRYMMRPRPDSVIVPTFFEPSISTTLRCADVVAVDSQFRALALAILSTPHSSHLAPESVLRQQLLSVVEQSAPAGAFDIAMPAPGPARLVAEALRDDPADSRTIDEWARDTHSSARTIERAFRRDTGNSFQQWRILCRMESAKALLRSADSVTSVAIRVGYQSQSSFARAFRAHTGTTPGAFVRNRAR